MVCFSMAGALERRTIASLIERSGLGTIPP
jgi:hypothetical protein